MRQTRAAAGEADLDVKPERLRVSGHHEGNGKAGGGKVRTRFRIIQEVQSDGGDSGAGTGRASDTGCCMLGRACWSLARGCLAQEI